MSNRDRQQSDDTSVQRFPRPRLVPEDEKWWSSKKIFNRVHAYLTSQIHFTEDWQPVVVALWVMGTYLYRQFPCYGHLWLNSLTTHSGKTKLLNVLHALCDKAEAPQIEPTQAVLFRWPSAIGGTLLIDEVDNLDVHKKKDIIAVLNHYHKNGTVSRMAPGKKGAFKLERFQIYCPKVIAGIESLPVTLQDRCIRIALHRKKSGEKVNRFLPENYDRGLPLRNQLHDWSVRKARLIIRAYRDRKHLGVPKDVADDRVRDILEPLFAIAKVLPTPVRQKLAEAAGKIYQGRRTEEETSNPAVAAIQILMERFPKGEKVWIEPTAKVCALLEEIPGLEDKPAAQAVLRKMGFKGKGKRYGKHVLQSYRIPRSTLETLAERYAR
jgi:hypothetical protein